MLHALDSVVVQETLSENCDTVFSPNHSEPNIIKTIQLHFKNNDNNNQDLIQNRFPVPNLFKLQFWLLWHSDKNVHVAFYNTIAFFAKCSVFLNNISQTVSRTWSEARHESPLTLSVTISLRSKCSRWPLVRNALLLHTIQARLHLKDLINGCVTAVDKHIHQKNTELICHSCHHNTLLAPIKGSPTCWRKSEGKTSMLNASPWSIMR